MLAELADILVRARNRAAMMAILGLVIVASGGVYVGFLSWLMRSGFPMISFLYQAALGAVPLVVGLSITIAATARVRILRHIQAHPQDLVAAEHALRFGRPAVRLRMADNRTVDIISGTLDRGGLDRQLRR